MTTVSDMLFQFGGTPVSGPDILQTGIAIFVKPSSGLDGNDGLSPDTAVKTLAKALSKATANNGDVVYLIAESNTAASTTDYQSATLDWNKDGVHLIGINCGGMIGQRSRIASDSTAAALNPLVKISANNCLVKNLEIFQGTPASGTTSVALQVTGQRNVIVNCQIAGNGDLTGVVDVSGSRSLLVSGSENLFRHCAIGLDTVIRATQTCEVEITGGARNIFEDCIVNSYTSLSTFKAIKLGTPDRFVNLVRCMLIATQNITSAVAPTGAIDPGSINGQVNILDGGVFGYADVTTADSSLVKLLSHYATTVVDMGVAKNTDVA